MEEVVQGLQQQNAVLVEELRLLREQTTEAFTRLSDRLEQTVPQPVPSQPQPVNVNVAPVINSSASSS